MSGITCVDVSAFVFALIPVYVLSVYHPERRIMKRNYQIVDTFTVFAKRIRYGRKYRDSFFCELFGHDKAALLELYSALNGSSYSDPNDIEVVTIENAIYITTKNDVAYLLNGTINLYEHQSTYNPNMPVRFLIYLAQEYQKYIQIHKESMFNEKQISLPTPKCVVFFNGEDKLPDIYELKLSEAFSNKEVVPDAELTVHVYNVNAGHNKELMEKCKTLNGYSVLIDKITAYKRSMSYKAAIEMAIEECIEEDTLRGFLMSHRSEVLGSLLAHPDLKKLKRNIRDDAIAEGLAIGQERGLAEGRAEAIAKLTEHLRKENPDLTAEHAREMAESILK